MTEAWEPTGPGGTIHVRHAPGAPSWVSLMVHGLEATQEFYGSLFGWRFRPGPQHFGPYVRAVLHDYQVAGIGKLPPDRHLPIAWTPYLGSDDVDATAEAVLSCGGTVGVGPLDADDAGRLAIAADPVGAVFGVWQAAAHPGTGLTDVPGTPVWYELLTYDTASVATFYRSVFGYTEEPVVLADLDYLLLHIDDRPVAGIHGVGPHLPPDQGPHWMTYFEVADVDAAAQRVTELGGHVVHPACNTALGRMVTVADPEGAVFSVVSRPH
ncbi:VOC family protein [Streptomyces sp. RY43-2]|uniref:VOC family protein n=1 Tax=Streptomyces macrolidinus TaxID=2952607 RepID=A0ABT0ZFX1_9ACTN|nr:VOC family protein [Streptomyces macrolidinus]MCN9242469.1 VOC family protein [Streptomyces macrolidinus]